MTDRKVLIPVVTSLPEMEIEKSVMINGKRITIPSQEKEKAIEAVKNLCVTHNDEKSSGVQNGENSQSEISHYFPVNRNVNFETGEYFRADKPRPRETILEERKAVSLEVQFRAEKEKAAANKKSHYPSDEQVQEALKVLQQRKRDEDTWSCVQEKMDLLSTDSEVVRKAQRSIDLKQRLMSKYFGEWNKGSDNRDL